MNILIDDCKMEIVTYLKPKELMNFCIACDFGQGNSYLYSDQFVVQCTEFVSDDIIRWFQQKNIKLNLLKTYKIDRFGTQFWYRNNKKHRDNDLPAEIHADGSQYWYQNGKYHRDNDMPSLIHATGRKVWFQNDLIHRDNDLPAEIWSMEPGKESKRWYQNDKLHRSGNKPAVIYMDGTSAMYINGYLILKNY